MRKIGIFFLLIALLLGGGYFLFSKKIDLPNGGNVFEMMTKVTSKDVNIKATFDIYTLGTRRIFTDTKYHNLSPYVFISSESPNTVNVKKEEVTWQDFFDTLPMKLTSDCLTTGTGQLFCSGVDGQLKFYINQREDPDALTKNIKEGDKLLVEYQ